MFDRFFPHIKKSFLVTVPEQYKNEFDTYINCINLSRAKITAAMFIFLETLVLMSFITAKKDMLFYEPGIYYGFMYILAIVIMAGYLLLFIRLGKDINKKGRAIVIAGVTFTFFLLSWCMVISLLDQLSYGQIIVYVAALLAIAAMPLFPPVIMLFVYLINHGAFLFLMPYFQKSSDIIFRNYLNSTTTLIVALVISSIRYKNQKEIFNNRKQIQEKNIELEKVNKELEKVNNVLEKLTETDSLTGVSNRLAFDRKLNIEWDRCKHHSIPLSLIMIDIDFFKAFNDHYGHQDGDYCLKKVAAVLSLCARRSSDTVVRYGGDEYAVLLPHMKEENALKLAEQMRRRVEELAIPHAQSKISEYVTISLGVNTVIPSEKLTINEFIRTADKALYEAKKENRNKIGIA